MFEPCLKVKSIMDKFGYPWFIESGWAIDLFLDKETRIHENIEIGIYRKHQMQLYRFFDKRKKYYINNKSRIGKQEKKEWNKEYLQLPIYELYIEYMGEEIKVLLNERDENNWIYRLNDKIVLDEKKVIQFTDSRIPYLCAEIVLLNKTNKMKDKDIEDISSVSKKMNEAQIKWLIDSIVDQTTKEKVRNLTNASTL